MLNDSQLPNVKTKIKPRQLSLSKEDAQFFQLQIIIEQLNEEYEQAKKDKHFSDYSEQIKSAIEAYIKQEVALVFAVEIRRAPMTEDAAYKILLATHAWDATSSLPKKKAIILTFANELNEIKTRYAKTMLTLHAWHTPLLITHIAATSKLFHIPGLLGWAEGTYQTSLEEARPKKNVGLLSYVPVCAHVRTSTALSFDEVFNKKPYCTAQKILEHRYKTTRREYQRLAAIDVCFNALYGLVDKMSFYNNRFFRARRLRIVALLKEAQAQGASASDLPGIKKVFLQLYTDLSKMSCTMYTRRVLRLTVSIFQKHWDPEGEPLFRFSKKSPKFLGKYGYRLEVKMSAAIKANLSDAEAYMPEMPSVLRDTVKPYAKTNTLQAIQRDIFSLKAKSKKLNAVKMNAQFETLIRYLKKKYGRKNETYKTLTAYVDKYKAGASEAKLAELAKETQATLAAPANLMEKFVYNLEEKVPKRWRAGLFRCRMHEERPAAKAFSRLVKCA